MPRRLFGTDGVRGVANVHPMTVEMAVQIGRAAAHVVKDRDRRHRIIIGKDTRLSGYMLENALAAGICSMGVDVLLVGPLPTPGIAFLTQSMRADAGVVISASHNPFQDNGIKIFSRDGYKFPDAWEERMEDLIFSDEIGGIRPTAEEVGKAYRLADARGRYIVYLKNTFPRDLSLDGLTIVVDCAHGAAYRVAPEVLSELGAQVIPLHVTPDGENINRDCGAVYPERMCRAVREAGADVGVALDGDGDRVILCDETGALVTGDHVLTLMARRLAARHALAQRTVVGTVMTNGGLAHALAPLGIQVVRAPVGDRYVLEAMRTGGYTLGGEPSGHVIFLAASTTGDGILTALHVLSVMQREGTPLSGLRAEMVEFPQVLVNVRAKERTVLDRVPGISKAIQEAEAALGSGGRVVVRWSGTEPVLRVMAEGEDAACVRRVAEDLAGAMRRALPA